MSSMQYSDNICEAINIIAQNVVKGLNFDQTILCTITDDSKSKQGEYIITDGSSNYSAHSNNYTYKNGTQVYVLVPNGDYTQQKIIISEYASDLERQEEKGYIKPIDTIIPVETIYENTNESGLIANGKGVLNQGIAINIPWSEKDLSFGPKYTRLSLEGSFRTDFYTDEGDYTSIIKGDYSLVLRLSGVLNSGETVSEKPYIFNCDRFFGDPYRLNGVGVVQSIVFDISDFKELNDIIIQFQESGNFYDKDGKYYVTSKDNEGNLLNNIFVKNIKIILGFDIEEYKNNDLILTSTDPLSYDSKEPKHLQLNWVRKRNNNTTLSINDGDDVNPNNYKYLTELKNKGYISSYWYRYFLSAQSGQDPFTKDYFYTVVKKYNDELYGNDIGVSTEDFNNTFTFDFATDIDGRTFERIKAAIAITGCFRKKILKTQHIEVKETADAEPVIKEVTVLKEVQPSPYTLSESKKYELDYDFIYYDPLDEIDPGYLKDNCDKTTFESYYYDTENGMYKKFEDFTGIEKESFEWVRQYEQKSLSLTSLHNSNDIKIEVDSNNKAIYDEIPTYIYLTDSEYNLMEDEKAYYVTNSSGGSVNTWYKLVAKDGSEDGSFSAYQLKLSPITFLQTNPVTFENRFTETVDFGNVNLIDGIKLECLDEFKGRYYLYGIDNTIPMSISNNAGRYIQVSFTDITAKDLATDNIKIQWKIPKDNSMIADPFPNTTATIEIDSGEPEGIIIKDIIIDNWIEENDFWKCMIEIEGTKSDGSKNDNYSSVKIKIPYQINSYYSPSFTNNSIFCQAYKRILGKNIIYNNAEYELRFGPSGSNGTNFSLSLSLGKVWNESLDTVMEYQRRSFLKSTDYNDKLWTEVEIALYDGNNLVIDNSFDRDIVWKWHNGIEVTNDKGIYNVMQLQTKGNSAFICPTYPNNNDTWWPIEYYAILQATVKYQGIDLVAYLPIPMVFRLDKFKSYSFEILDKIVYNGNGTNPIYYKNQLKFFEKYDDGTIEANSGFKVDTIVGGTSLTEIDKGIYVYFDENKNPIVPQIYQTGIEKEKVSLRLTSGGYAILVQPVLIIQNRFGNAMLNEWDGSLTIDKENNRLLAAQMAVGTKDTDNTFTGVILGKVNQNITDESIKEVHGLYGYQKGALSFGFTETGKAFIGRSGYGQILFDGDQGTITSSGYYTNNEGLRINLETGFLKSQGAGGSITIDPREKNKKNLFNVKSSENKTLINIGVNNNYLQSNNYESRTKGFKLAFDSDGFSISKKLSSTNDSSGAGIVLASLSPYFKIEKNYSNYARAQKLSKVSKDYTYDLYIHPLGIKIIIRNTSSNNFYSLVLEDNKNKDILAKNIIGFLERVSHFDYKILVKNNDNTYPTKPTSYTGHKYRILGSQALTNLNDNYIKGYTKLNVGIEGSPWSYDEKNDCVIYDHSIEDNKQSGKVSYHIAEIAPKVEANTKQIVGNNVVYAGHANSIAYHKKSGSFVVAIGTDPIAGSSNNRIIFYRYNKAKNTWDTEVSCYLRGYSDKTNPPTAIGKVWQLAIEEDGDVLYVLRSKKIYSFNLDYDKNNDRLINVDKEGRKYYIKLGDREGENVKPEKMAEEQEENNTIRNSVLGGNVLNLNNTDFTYQGMAVDDKYFYLPCIITNSENKDKGKILLDIKYKEKNGDGNYAQVSVEEGYNKTYPTIEGIDSNYYEIEELAFHKGYMYISFGSINPGYMARIYKIKFNNNNLPGKIYLDRDAENLWYIISPQSSFSNGVSAAQGFTLGHNESNELFFINAFIQSGDSNNGKPRTLLLNYLSDDGIKSVQLKKAKKLINIANDTFILESANYYYDSKHPKRSRGTQINLNDGKITSVNADITGKITATEGVIGGWSIQATTLKSSSSAAPGQDNAITLIPGGSQNTYKVAGKSSKGWVITAGKNFGVLKSGKLYAKEAEITGKITATSGKIAGFEIADSSTAPSNGFWKNSLSSVMKSGTTYYAVFMRNTGNASNVAFGVKKIEKWEENGNPTITEWNGDNEKYPAPYVFSINNKGKLFAKDAEITGIINATSGQFNDVTIGKWKVGDNAIYYGSSAKFGSEKAFLYPNTGKQLDSNPADDETLWWVLGIGSNFGVTKDGYLYAKAGKIGGWSIQATTLKSSSSAAPGQDNAITLIPGGSQNSYTVAGKSSKGWVITAGKNFGVLKSGKLYAKEAEITGKINATSGIIGGCKIVNGKLQIASIDVGELDTSKLSINGTQIAEGTITDNQIALNSITSEKIQSLNLSKINIDNSSLKFKVSNGTFYIENAKDANEGIEFAPGVAMLMTMGQYDGLTISNPNVSTINYNVLLSTTKKGGLVGSWYLDTGAAIMSDKKKKNSIEFLDERYEIFFKKLNSKRFKYNHGTSNRYHCGFISQEVGEALLKSNIDPLEFAGYVVDTANNEDSYFLRYDEFIALNTHMIQKCLKRIDELENEIKDLKAQLN